MFQHRSQVWGHFQKYTMDKASRALRRSGVKLLSLGGHSDLNVMISEVKDIRTSAKAFLQAQHLASQDMLRWAAHEDNHAIQDVVSQIAELNTLWTDVQRDFIERLKEFRQMFEMILTGQKHVSQAKTHLNTCEQKEVKVRKELKGAAKRASPAEIRIFETRLTQVQRAKDLAHVEVSDRVRENEAVKLIRLKEGMLKFTESYVEMATKCTILFSSQREVVLQIPDVHGRDLEDIKYSGSGATRFYVQEARGKLLKYRSNSCSSSASADTMNDPPPPYTPPDAVVTEAVTRNPRPAPRTSLPNPDRDVQHATPPRASLPYPEQNMEHSAGHRTSLPYSDQNMDHSTTSRTSLPYLDQNMEHSTTSHTSLPYPDQNMEHSTGQRTGLPNLDQHMDPSTALPIQNRGQGCGRCDSNSSTCSEGLMSMTKLDHSVTSTRDRGQVSGSFGSTHSSNTSNDGQIPRSNSGTFANVPVQATSQSSGFYESDKGVNPATSSYTPRENSVTSTTMSDPNKNKTADKSMHTPRLETTKLPDRDTGQTSGYYHEYTPNSEITSSYATHIMTQDSKGPEIAMPDSEYYRTPPMTQDQCGGVRPRQLYQPTQRDSIHEDEYSTADEEADGTTSHCDIK